MLGIEVVERRRRGDHDVLLAGASAAGGTPRDHQADPCARCGGSLFHTKAKGQPRQEDHEQGCVAFIRAIRAMRYVDELKRSASASAGTWTRTRRWQGYMREGAKKLTLAACASDPAAALSALGDSYAAECQTPGKRAKARQQTDMAEMLMRACRRLALGQEPEPIAPPRLAS